jgi:hypothetical protein
VTPEMLALSSESSLLRYIFASGLATHALINTDFLFYTVLGRVISLRLKDILDIFGFSPVSSLIVERAKPGPRM